MPIVFKTFSLESLFFIEPYYTNSRETDVVRKMQKRIFGSAGVVSLIIYELN